MRYRLASGERDAFTELEQPAEQDPFASVRGNSPALTATIEMARRFARRGAANILLIGETGTGKEVFARAIHYSGPNGDAPFVAVNCAAIPAALLESELFGYERGAFTDAKRKKQGLLELAMNGTLFLDEISSLPVDLQPKLLRALEERRVRRVGGFDEVEIRCRVTAATNESLEELVDEGSFREDLFYRLNVLRLNLPPLREREGDIFLLANYFLDQASAAQGLPPAELSPEAVVALETHSWPGNVRQLKNVMERASALSEGGVIRPEALELRSSRDRDVPTSASTVGRSIGIPEEGRSLRSVESELIRHTLEITGGNKSAAARILGISRPTLHRKVDEYSADWGQP